ncbi:MAG: sigma-70 family RNA polymerase sigma factor [Candidatus Gracilibacteria bacterium]
MSTSENSYINKCKQGDLSQFAHIYDAYIQKIYNYIYYRVHHKETAEDLAAQCFTKAMENIKKYDEVKGTFSSWLYKIAKNTIFDHFRTLKTHLDIDDIWDLKSSTDIETDADTGMKVEKVKEYLKKLKPEHREIVIMRVWDGLSYKEISEITGKTEGNLKVIFSRAVAEIRESNIVVLSLLLILPAIINLE